MESTTYLKNVKISPKKLRFFTSEIKKMTPYAASEKLMYTPNKAARVFYKAIKSAMANARLILKVNDDMLQFKTLLVEEGQKLKRYNPGSRGTAQPYLKRYSHIKIVLTATQQPKEEKIVEKAEETQPKETKTAKTTVKTPKKTTVRRQKKEAK